MSGVEVGVLAATMAIAGTVAQSYGEYQEGKYQSRVMKANANVLQQNAQRKRLETALNEDIAREQNRRQIAKNEAAMIEQGSLSQTSIGVLGQQATDLEQNVLNSRYQGISAAEAMDIEATYMRQNAKATKKQAKNKFYTDLIFKAPSAGFSAYSKFGGSLSPQNKTPNYGTYTLSDNRKYEAWSGN